jgi:hypothetical protein
MTFQTSSNFLSSKAQARSNKYQLYGATASPVAAENSRQAGQVGLFILPVITSAVSSTGTKTGKNSQPNIIKATPHQPYQADGPQNRSMSQRLNALLRIKPPTIAQRGSPAPYNFRYMDRAQPWLTTMAFVCLEDKLQAQAPPEHAAISAPWTAPNPCSASYEGVPQGGIVGPSMIRIGR